MATRKTKRPPRQVWIVVRDHGDTSIIPATATTRQRATDLIEDDCERVVGPYVLAERVRER